jgi:hypothetical protein
MRACGIRTTPGGQQQVPDIVSAHQVPCDQGAKHSGSPRDEHGPVRIERPRHRLGLPGGQSSQPWYQKAPTPEGDLGVSGSGGCGQDSRGRIGSVGVDQPDVTVRMLGLCSPGQPPHRRVREISHVLAGVHGDRPSSEQHKP